ncbi:two-component sensor histidine kinase [Corynebacterium sp. zg254]|uniref:sensor histidine kinase n=1 Tax=Corynebacterium sp. zg254 TaxID=2656645 RepID=UPI002150E3D0|nr:ATP-binding protein [Corynebacterium sp. zg254]MCR5914231.1 two-component sensor histidine kinase [Corynebacterium sp. zg254]
MSELGLAVLCGVAAGVLVTVVAVLLYRLRVRELRHRKTQADLEDNKVSTVSQVLYFAVQSSPDAVVVVDKRRSVVLSNPRAHELGLVKERMVHPEVWEIVEQVLVDQVSREMTVKPVVQRGARPVMEVAGHVQLLTLTDDRYVVVYASDVSEQIRMESARRDFVANVSHELKTPVGAISLLVETMMSVKDDPESVEYFGGKLTKEVSRMSTMITELISLSKLQGAESLPDPQILDIDSIVDAAVERCRLAAETAGIEIVTDAGLGVPVRGDRNLLVTALSNLVTNAINYSPQGNSVSISRRVDAGAVRLSVTDRGIGIAPEDHERVFERFFRVDKGRSRDTGGTGLGLAIVKHVMVNHGGSVSLWSRPGTGSTFTLELPVYDEAQQKAAGGYVSSLSLGSGADDDDDDDEALN